MIPEIGQRFGPYEILGRLGGGGMGLIFRAWDERLHREVAVKMLNDAYRMPGMRERFLQEARAASRLNHPNICMIFDIGERDGDPYLVMELLEGETLRDRIGHGALSTEEIVRYGAEIADALTVAHAKGIVHRDIKPSNIFLMMMPDGRSQTKVLDFGLAKIGLERRGGWESRTLDLTLEGLTVGTLPYMSPEQARGESLDARSDLFSLGVVMYEMATRRVPFRGPTSEVIFEELSHETPEPVRGWNESIPRELERVILRLLAKDRKERFQTAQELRDALLRISIRTGKGRWLNRETAVVPLVQAHDPVARYRHSRMRQEEPQEQARSSESKRNDLVIRPVRMPEREGEGVIVQPPSKKDSSAEGDRSSRGARESGSEARRSPPSQLAAEDASGGSEDPVSRRAGSEATQFEYGPDETEPLERTVAEEEQAASAPLDHARKHVRIAVAAMLLVLVGGGAYLIVRRGFLQSVVLGPKDRFLLTVIQNKTGDQTLDGTVMEGMEIAMQQSKSLNVFGEEAYQAGLRQIQADGGGRTVAGVEQRVAQKVGAKVYLYGEIHTSRAEPGASYTISVDVLKTDSNDEVASLAETAQSRDAIPAAVGRLAQRVRREVGDGDTRKTVSMEQDATANVNALHAFAVGESMKQSGRVEEALKAYREAATLDPQFAQAQMMMAWMYRGEKAEIASAESAGRARSAAMKASDKVKMLADFCFQINSAGDYDAAAATIHRFVAQYPLDTAGMRGLSRVLRLEGYLPEALLAAKQSYDKNPFDAESYREGELAMVGMDRYDGVLKLQAKRMGVTQDEGASTAAYLGIEAKGKEESSSAGEAVNPASGVIPDEIAQMSYAELNGRGLYLDNMGRMSEGLALWKMAAAKAGGVPEMQSTKAYMLARGALDRAFARSCALSLEMVDEAKTLPMGPIARFNAGMAAALCGDKTYAEKTSAALRQEFPRNTMAEHYYLPELEAAADIGINEPMKALKVLEDLRAPETVLLVPYLRGTAHAAVGQMPQAIIDFQTVLAHRGAAFLMGSNIYPMAQIDVARAYAADGDKADSAIAYRRFLALWQDADKGEPQIKEAIAKSK